MTRWFWDVLKRGSGEAGVVTQAEEGSELSSEQAPLSSGQLLPPFYTPSCSDFSSLPPASGTYLSLLNAPFVPKFLLPNYWLLVYGQLASAHLSEFTISLGRGLRS